jgi:hypothetical protein
MKRKYHGMLSVGALLTVMVSIGGYYYSGLWRQVYAGPEATAAPVADVWVPSQEQIQSMARLSGTLHALAVPTARSDGASPLLLFGQRLPHLGSGSGPVESAAAQGLSLTLLAGPVRYCVVNGDFVAEGTRLESGARIVKIEHRRALISSGEKMEWLYIEDDPQVLNQKIERKNMTEAPPRKGSS